MYSYSQSFLSQFLLIYNQLDLLWHPHLSLTTSPPNALIPSGNDAGRANTITHPLVYLVMDQEDDRVEGLVLG